MWLYQDMLFFVYNNYHCDYIIIRVIAESGDNFPNHRNHFMKILEFSQFLLKVFWWYSLQDVINFTTVFIATYGVVYFQLIHIFCTSFHTIIKLQVREVIHCIDVYWHNFVHCTSLLFLATIKPVLLSTKNILKYITINQKCGQLRTAWSHIII